MDPVLEEKKFVWHKPAIIMMSFISFALVMGCAAILVLDISVVAKIIAIISLIVVYGGAGVYAVYTNLCVINGDCNKLALATAIMTAIGTGLVGLALLAIVIAKIAGVAPPRVRMPYRTQSVRY